MSRSFLLGLDYGTGSAKACLIDENANVLSYANEEYSVIMQYAGWSEHNALRYWEIACELIKQCIKKAGVAPDEINAIGVSSALPSMVMVDKDGNCINNAYNLMDRRAVEQVNFVRRTIGEKNVFDLTGNRLEDHPSLINLLWEKENRPDSFAKIHKALTIDGYIAYKLTGRFTAHYSAAPFFGVAYNIRTNKFDQTMMNKLGIDMDILPQLCASDDIIGNVTQKAAQETGLTVITKVAGGQVDCNAAWLGAGAIEPGDIQMNLGTCGNFGIIHDDKNFLDTMIVFPYTVNAKETYITVPTTTTGGQALRYIRDNFSQAELAAEELSGMDTYEMLNVQVVQIPPGSEGLVVLPYLMGERTPIWDVYAKGVVFGLSLRHTKAHIIRAVMESVAYALYDSFRIIRDTGMKINYPIIFNEGGAKSKLWRKIITDVFNAPTALVKNRVGAPYGDAILAGVACGVFSDFSIAKEKAEYIDLMEPNDANHKIYMEYFKIYKNIYTHLKEDFVDLYDLIKEK